MKMRCNKCVWLDYDVFDNMYESHTYHFCGLHGRARVNPDGEQQNLNGRESCGFTQKRDKPKPTIVQLTFDFW